MSKREHYVEKRKAPQQMGILKKVKKNQETFQTHGSCGRDSEYDNVCQFRLTAESCTIKSSIETLTSPVSYSYSFIYFDLETTGLEKDSDITQIAAIHGKEAFSTYCMPIKVISPGATYVTGLTVRDGKLYKNKLQVEYVSLQNGIEKFLLWICKFKNPLLIAHNCKNFDAIILFNNVMKYCPSVTNRIKTMDFADTLPFFREQFPGRISYRQESLVSDLLKESYYAHNAVEDCKYLQKLCNSCDNLNDLLRHSFSLSSFKEYNPYNLDARCRNQQEQNFEKEETYNYCCIL